MNQAGPTVHTVIVGVGHSGLMMSRLAGQAGREHVVVDRRPTLGGGWQDRWDAFRLVSPNWTTSVPGFDYRGSRSTSPRTSRTPTHTSASACGARLTPSPGAVA